MEVPAEVVKAVNNCQSRGIRNSKSYKAIAKELAERNAALEAELREVRAAKLDRLDLADIRADAFNEGFAAARKLFSSK